MTVVLLVVVLLSLFCLATSRTLCLSGSDMYQKITVDCNAQEPSYKGTWFCATVHVCESFISSNRQCMMTKGCAKAEQCLEDPTTLYDGQNIKSSLGEYPAGMKIKVECCQTMKNDKVVDFADDDGALDYDLICNSAGKTYTYSALLVIALTSIASVFFI